MDYSSTTYRNLKQELADPGSLTHKIWAFYAVSFKGDGKWHGIRITCRAEYIYIEFTWVGLPRSKVQTSKRRVLSKAIWESKKQKNKDEYPSLNCIKIKLCSRRMSKESIISRKTRTRRVAYLSHRMQRLTPEIFNARQFIN